MSVQNVVLGQLIQRRGYGYELADRLRTWTEALELSDAAIYAALRQLERRGLIAEAGRERARPNDWQRGQRVIFEATKAGRSHFAQWMASTPRKVPLREELHMQLIVAEEDDLPKLVESMRQIEEDCREALGRVLALSLHVPDPAHARVSPFGAPLVLDGLTSHLQATMRWAQRSRQALSERIEHGAATTGRRRP